ncbi:MAG: MarR family winged helix-turn-helix transcriptional regulator [Methylovirgula sp.]
MNEINLREVADCTCARLQRTTRRVTQIYDRALAPVDLTVNQFGLLARLYGARLLQRDGMSIKALADMLGMDSSTLTRNLKPLEARGLIDSAIDPNDGRARLIAITAAGTAKLAQALPHWRSAQREVKRQLGSAASGELRTLLDTAFTTLAES